MVAEVVWPCVRPAFATTTAFTDCGAQGSGQIRPSLYIHIGLGTGAVVQSFHFQTVANSKTFNKLRKHIHHFTAFLEAEIAYSKFGTN